MLKSIIGVIYLVVLAGLVSPSSQDVKPFATPLYFYNIDMLRYLQILYNQQRYEEMSLFITGPIACKGNENIARRLSVAQFGYQLQRKGVRKISEIEWSLTYTRIINGTSEAFKVLCKTENDTCKIILDEFSWSNLFHAKYN